MERVRTFTVVESGGLGLKPLAIPTPERNEPSFAGNAANQRAILSLERFSLGEAVPLPKSLRPAGCWRRSREQESIDYYTP